MGIVDAESRRLPRCLILLVGGDVPEMDEVKFHHDTLVGPPPCDKYKGKRAAISGSSLIPIVPLLQGGGPPKLYMVFLKFREYL